MSKGWENVKPAPTEVLHSEIMKEFHEHRKQINPEDTTVSINGIDLGNIIARAKKRLYREHPEYRENVPKKSQSELSLDDALCVAKGCFDYSGGHRGDQLKIFHHGIQTVINALEGAKKSKLTSLQSKILHRIGKGS